MSEREFEAYLAALAKLTGLSPSQRDAIAQELRDHMESRLESLYAEGLDRDAAIDQALEEFGDANLLARNLAAPKRQALRRRLVNTSLATAAVAALAVVLTTSLLPANNPASAPPATAQQTPEQADPAPADPAAAFGHGRRAGRAGAHNTVGSRTAGDHHPNAFVYVMGDTPRPGAYAVPGENTLTLVQLVASAGGTPDNLPLSRVHAQVFSRADNAVRLEGPLSDFQQPGQTPAFVNAGDVVTLRRLPSEGDPNVSTAVVDLTQILILATGYEDHDLYQNDWILRQQDELINALIENAHGMGFTSDDDLVSVTCWMGVLTLVGTDPALQQVQTHILQLRDELEKRAAVREARREQERARQHAQLQAEKNAQALDRNQRELSRLEPVLVETRREVQKAKRDLELARIDGDELVETLGGNVDASNPELRRMRLQIESREADLAESLERLESTEKQRQMLQAAIHQTNERHRIQLRSFDTIHANVRQQVQAAQNDLELARVERDELVDALDGNVEASKPELRRMRLEIESREAELEARLEELEEVENRRQQVANQLMQGPNDPATPQAHANPLHRHLHLEARLHALRAQDEHLATQLGDRHPARLQLANQIELTQQRLNQHYAEFFSC